jgi:alpha-N-arabinofuranosidase
MANAAGSFDALALHYYTLPGGDWLHKGSATEFTESDWIGTLESTLHMDELLNRHEAIMDRYDPARRVALDVDEWGLWHEVEPDTNPGFLFQQNTLRDALAAALNLHIFHRHAARVRMANIAQMVNVLQAMVLTQGDKLVLTPTYHVYDMYQVFQGAKLLPLDLDAPRYQHGGHSVPAVDASAARDAAGVIHVAIVNLDARQAAAVTLKIVGAHPGAVSGRLLTAPAMNAYNSFDAPPRVRPVAFSGATLQGDVLSVSLPAKSVVVLGLN